MQNIWSHIAAWWTELIAITPAASWRFMWLYGALIVSLFVIGIALRFLPLLPSLKNRLSSLVWSNFWLGLVLFFLRYQRIPLFGMDLLRFLQEVGLVVWTVFVIRYALTSYRKERLDIRVQAYKERYLPKQKGA